jgi:hypothetical protein
MTHLAVVRGLTYSNFSQVFNRWLIPSYRTAFRWTGNRVDAEDVITWTFRVVASNLRLPDLVQGVDDQVVDAAVEAVARHWNDSYGIAHISHVDMYISEGCPALESLFDGLTAEMRLLLGLRFVRRRSPPAIAAQLRISPEAARRNIIDALALVAHHIGLPAASGGPLEADQVSTYIDDLIARRRPLRFEVRRAAWPPMLGAGHVQAAIAGNDLPAQGFVRSLERRLSAGWTRRPVTDIRIWSA